MKYIVLKSTLAGMEQKIPIIFPNFMVHSFVAKYIAGMLIRQHDRPSEITVASAGEITMTGIECSGKSDTCKVSSDPNDSDMIAMHDYFQGLETDPDLEKEIRRLLEEHEKRP